MNYRKIPLSRLAFLANQTAYNRPIESAGLPFLPKILNTNERSYEDPAFALFLRWFQITCQNLVARLCMYRRWPARFGVY
jgi:hypothetical protein